MEDKQATGRVARETVTNQVFEILRDRITSGALSPGDKLPSESELARQFNISRMSVRMALQKLAALGLVVTVNGGGTYVKQFEFSELVGNFSGILSQGISFEDMNQYRYVLEEKAIENLRGRKLPERDAEYLRACVRRMAHAARGGDIDGFSSADYDFHRYTCVLSGNKMFVYAYDLCRTIYIEYLSSQYSLDRYRMVHGEAGAAAVRDGYEDAVDKHQRMVECLENGDVDCCLQILREFTGYM